jgi:carbon storage regulator
MLVLTRREGERIALGEDIVVTVVSIQGNKVRLGVAAPDDIVIRRGELLLDVDATMSGCQLAEQV